MAEIKICRECGVPEQITGEYSWLNSGAMVQTKNMSRRVGFIESENLDPLYEGIGKIIGLPIDHLVMDVVRRGTAEYFGNLIQPEVRGMIRSGELGVDFIAESMVIMGLLNGFGKYEILDLRYQGDQDDHAIVRVSEPFSLLLCVGAQLGSCEIISGNPCDATYVETSPRVFEISAYYASARAEEMEGRMLFKEYHHRDGDIELERCATCGGPKALGRFEWLLDRGVIFNSRTRRRMAMIGPQILDPLFDELEMELGEDIPRAVVEAQMRFVKTGFYNIGEISDEGAFREQLALRGMGNLRKIRIGPPGLYMCIDNAANYLMAVGTVQGLFEMAFDVESSVDWTVSERGDLEVQVSPKH